MTFSEDVRQVVEHVSSRLNRGEDPASVKNALVFGGMRPESADEMIATVLLFRRRASRIAGLKAFAVGVALLVGGLVVTFGTYAAAPPGGTYIVLTGLLAVGAVLTLFGLLRATTGWNFDRQLSPGVERVANSWWIKPLGVLIVLFAAIWIADHL